MQLLDYECQTTFGKASLLPRSLGLRRLKILITELEPSGVMTVYMVPNFRWCLIISVGITMSETIP